VFAFVRRGESPDALVLVVSNFTPVVQQDYRLGVPRPGVWRECINTDSAYYGGSNVGAPFGEITAEDRPWNDRPHSIVLALPPLATVFLEWKA
jgi:1,4-alpha-glucan branching enzyme